MPFPIELEIITDRLRKLFGPQFTLKIVPHPTDKKFYLSIDKTIHGKPYNITIRFPTDDDLTFTKAMLGAFDRARLRIEGKLPPLPEDKTIGRA